MPCHITRRRILNTSGGSAFDGGVIEDSPGHFIRVGKPFDTTPVTFAVNNKRFARATTVLLMQGSQFAWPHLEALWYPAPIYQETGEGHLSLADDIAGGDDEAQVSPVQEMGAAQDDLRAGSDFAIPEATSAGW